MLNLDLFQRIIGKGMSQLYEVVGGRKESHKDEVHETWHKA